jgi:hypothetical protein
LDARLTTLLCKRIIVAKSKKVKPGWFPSSKEAMAKNVCFANDDNDDDDSLTPQFLYRY